MFVWSVKAVKGSEKRYLLLFVLWCLWNDTLALAQELQSVQVCYDADNDEILMAVSSPHTHTRLRV